MNRYSKKVKRFFINIFIFFLKLGHSTQKPQKTGICQQVYFLHFFILHDTFFTKNPQKTDSLPIRIAESIVVSVSG